MPMTQGQYDWLIARFGEFVKNFSMQEALDPDDVKQILAGYLHLNGFAVHAQLLDELLKFVSK